MLNITILKPNALIPFLSDYFICVYFIIIKKKMALNDNLWINMWIIVVEKVINANITIFKIIMPFLSIDDFSKLLIISVYFIFKKKKQGKNLIKW